MLCCPLLRTCAALSAASVLTGCDPSVSDIDMKTEQSRVEKKRAELAETEKEYKALSAEVKELVAFGGAGHEQKLRQAAALRHEKEELEGIKKELDARIARFTSGAQKHRDALAKEKP
jgi:hypothetical protein